MLQHKVTGSEASIAVARKPIASSRPCDDPLSKFWSHCVYVCVCGVLPGWKNRQSDARNVGDESCSRRASFSTVNWPNLSSYGAYRGAWFNRPHRRRRPGAAATAAAAAAAADAARDEDSHHLAAATQHASDDCFLYPPTYDFLIIDAVETTRSYVPLVNFNVSVLRAQTVS